ncbi:MAG: PAS domain S-box protein [Nitrospiraceae bacterium]|nr:PAS domain S-box protein [Nitrospiraceae bacterium]
MTLITRLRTIDLKLLIVFSVLVSEILTSIMSIILLGKITGEYLITGGVVSLIASTIIVYLFRQIIRLAEDNETLQREINNRKAAEKALIESEQKYRRLIETTNTGYVIIDPQGKVLDANQEYIRLTGYTTLEEITGRNVVEWTAEVDREKNAEEVRKCLDRGFARNVEILYAGRDGRMIPIEMNSTVIKDAAGTKILTLCWDISSRINADEERKKLESQLRYAQKIEAVGQLAGGVAHDFNNILSAIIGYGHITLVKMAKDDPLKVNIEQMLAAADRAAHLTKDLLLFSRRQISDRRPVDLNGVIRTVEKFLVRVIGEDIAFKTILHEGPMPVLADVHQLEQVLMNLATNARDAMPKGGSLIIATEQIMLDKEFIAIHGYGNPGMYATITAADTGMGMDEHTRQRIFEPFFTTKEVGKGTGLGMAVAYGIIKKHEGYINVCSEPGKGATFRIYLPVIASEIIEEKKEAQVDYPEKGAETMLFAEDDESLRELTVSMLQEFGYEVIVAVDGEDAVKKYIEEKDRIQLLLFDIVMPKKTGKEAYDEIKRIKPDIKVIFLSGYAPDIIRQKALLENNEPVAYKPISPADLLKKIRSVLN